MSEATSQRNSATAHKWKRYPKYKDSGVEWLGEVPEGWILKKAKWLFKEIVDRNHPSEPLLSVTQQKSLVTREESDINVWNPTDDVSGYKLVKKGDFVISLRSFQGGIEHSSVQGIVSPAYTVFRQKNLICNNYFRYLFKSEPFVSVLNISTTGIRQGKNIGYEDFSLIVCPTLLQKDCESLAAFLDIETARIDALIIKKEQQIELLKETQGILIDHVVTKGLDPNAKMKDSGIEWIGEVPDNWEIKKLKQLSYRISGRLVFKPAQYFTDSGIPFLFGNNITENGFLLEDVKYLPVEINERFKHHALKTDDLVMVRVGAPGLTAVIPKELEGLNCASMIIIRKSSVFNSDWLSFVLNSQIGKAQVDSVTYGAAQEQINVSDVINFLIPTPSLEEQKQIQNHLKEHSANFQKTIAKISHSIAFLKEYRTTLISAAVTGKIDVRTEVR
jgi:type I restriction enzyme S subunit